MQDDGGRKIDAQSLVLLGIEDDVDDVFVKKLFELWTPRKPEDFSLVQFFWGLRIFRFDSLLGDGGFCFGLGLRGGFALSQ